MSSYLTMTPEQTEQFYALPVLGKVSMLNLLKYKDVDESTGLSGEEVYKQYMKEASPYFLKSGAKVIFYGDPKFTLIGPSDEGLWDKILIVEYSSKMDFLNMVSSEDYPVHTRNRALEDSRLIFCESN